MKISSRPLSNVELSVLDRLPKSEVSLVSRTRLFPGLKFYIIVPPCNNSALFFVLYSVKEYTRACVPIVHNAKFPSYRDYIAFAFALNTRVIVPRARHAS